MTTPIGLILTSAPDLATVRRHLDAGRLDALKVVTGWGLPQSWDDATRREALRLAPQTIVRTVRGDPSVAGGALWMPHAADVAAELAPWYAARDPARPLWFEVGNEPLIAEAPTDDDAWRYAWHLGDAIATIRARFPEAKIIGPAQLLNHPIRVGAWANGQERWTTLLADALRRCDALSLHVYSLEQYVRGLGQLRTLVGSQPVWVTEFALNEALDDAERGAAYAGLIRQFAVSGVLLYHLDTVGGSDPVHFNPLYRLTETVLASLAAALRAPEPVPAPPRPAITSVPMTRERLSRGRMLGPPRVLVMHATAGRHPGDLNWLRQGGGDPPLGPVSCHYYVDKRGRISQLVADHDTAWHCGAAAWQVDGRLVAGSHAGTSRLNWLSIGIELENRNTGVDPYPDGQIRSATALARHLVHRYEIPRGQLVRHLDIAPGRKTDPAGFPWPRFVADVYGGR